MVVEFVTQHPQTGAATDADALPVATVVLNGIDDAAVVTVANKATGVYKATFTPPTLATGDILALRVAATVAAVAGVGVVWQQQSIPAVNVTMWKDAAAPDMTGDAYARLGAPAGASVSADVAAVKADTAAIKAKTDLISASGSVSVTSAISGSTITITRGDSLSAAIATLGDISTRSKLWFTAKVDTEDADTAAIIQIEETAGLVYLNGAAGTAGLGDVTVTDENAGDITITLDETAADDLVPRKNMSYDVQMLTSTGTVTTLTSGTLHVVADVTRAVA